LQAFAHLRKISLNKSRIGAALHAVLGGGGEKRKKGRSLRLASNSMILKTAVELTEFAKNVEGKPGVFIRNGSDTPKLASAWLVCRSLLAGEVKLNRLQAGSYKLAEL